tara:strand:- start:26089 stop:26415 length:327 start_codon:yes stop_codon:yes gene_type:complete
MAKLHVKKGDTVKIIAGESKGVIGVIKEVMPSKQRVYVEGEGVKKLKKHQKPNAKFPEGGIIEIDTPIHISNVMVIDPKENVPTRIGRKRDENGKLVRYSKKSGEVLK